MNRREKILTQFMNKEPTMTLLSTGTDYDALAAAFRPIFTRIAQGAAEREQQRVLPEEPIRWLKEAGFGTLRIPREKGGWGASLPQLSALLIELAQADSTLPQALRAHFAFVEDQLNQPDSAGRDRWFRRFLDGELVGSGWTEIFIYPGYQFKVIDSLITNFHLPKSTLVMLVSAFATKDQIMTAYYEERAGELRDMAKRSQKADGFLEEAGLPDTVGNMQAALRLLDGETALDTVLELARESQSEQDAVGQLASETADAAVLETAMDHVVPQGVAASEASSEKETFAERRRDLTELTDGLKDVMEAIADGEEDEAALAEYCAGIDHFLENILEKTKQRADITYSEFQEIRATRGLMRLQQGLRNNRSYAVPIQTADGVTQMNLTFREDEEQAGKVQVTIWQPYRISMEMQISGGSLKGLVLCDDRAGYEKLKQQAGALQETLEQNVCPVKTISYGMDFRAQNDYSAAPENDNAVDTKALYQTAKVLVQYISEVVATENGGLQ